MKKGPPPSGAGPFFVCHGRVPDDRPGSLPVGGSEQDEAGAGDSKSPDHDWFSLPSDSGEVARVSDDNFYIGGRLAARVSARGYLVKNSPSARLVEAIEAVYEGRLCYPAELTELVLKEVARRSEDLDEEDESPGLSTRERQVVALVAAWLQQPGDRRSPDAERAHHRNSQTACDGQARHPLGGRTDEVRHRGRFDPPWLVSVQERSRTTWSKAGESCQRASSWVGSPLSPATETTASTSTVAAICR